MTDRINPPVIRIPSSTGAAGEKIKKIEGFFISFLLKEMKVLGNKTFAGAHTKTLSHIVYDELGSFISSAGGIGIKNYLNDIIEKGGIDR